MEASLKTGFAQIFFHCPKNLSCPKSGGGGGGGGGGGAPPPPPLAPPARTTMPIKPIILLRQRPDQLQCIHPTGNNSCSTIRSNLSVLPRPQFADCKLRYDIVRISSFMTTQQNQHLLVHVLARELGKYVER